MALYLAGGGNEDQSFLIDRDFSREVEKNRSILYIPIAQVNPKKYPGCEAWFLNCMGRHGINEIEMCTDLSQLRNLARFGGIYIGGGNTFKLLKEIKEASFDSLLLDYLDFGGTIYGGSAGAIIFGKSIDVVRYGCNDNNSVGIRNFSGLNKLSDCDIQCHFESVWLKKHSEYSKENSRTIIAIPEESGIKLSDNNLLVIGTEPVAVISGEKHEAIQPGKTVSLDSLKGL